MKYLNTLLLFTLISVLIGCYPTKEIKGVFVNLDVQKNDGYIADVRESGTPEIININEKGEFKFKRPKKGKTYNLTILNNNHDFVVGKNAKITDKTKNVIILNNGIEFWQKIIIVERDEDFNKIYDKAVNNFNKLDKEKSKIVRGTFVNLGDKSKRYRFRIFRITTQLDNVIDKKGTFSFKYPKNPETEYKLIIDFDRRGELGDPTIFVEYIPIDTEQIIALYDGNKKEIIFVKEGEDFNKIYEIALNKFKQTPNSSGYHTTIYPGCENNKIENYSSCFDNKINQHISKYLDVRSLDIPSGRKRINVLFEVDKTGKVNVTSVNSPNQELKREVIKVFKKLPIMKPAMEDNQPIKTEYNFPIIININ